MNCRPGDLALVIRGRSRGAVVTVESLVRSGEIVTTSGGSAMLIGTSLPGWHVDRELLWGIQPFGEPVSAKIAPDSALQPLRPLPGEPMTDITEQPIKSDERA